MIAFRSWGKAVKDYCLLNQLDYDKLCNYTPVWGIDYLGVVEPVTGEIVLEVSGHAVSPTIRQTDYTYKHIRMNQAVTV